jgi:hypothetical protein
MSLLGFQRALADLAASPARCARAILNPEPFLEAHDLTHRERIRLTAMMRDRLMATNCVLYRANRVTPIFVFFPLTCRLLASDLRRELDSFWLQTSCIDLQYRSETARFVEFLKVRLGSGELQNEFLPEILDYEAAATELQFAPPESASLTRMVRFTHDPHRLLEAMSGHHDIPADLVRGSYQVMLDARNKTLEVRIACVAERV